MHEKLGEYYVQIIDEETKEVIPEVPPKKCSIYMRQMVERIGLIINEEDFDRRNGKGSETIMVGVRVSGLASGMDIDSIVSDLMKAERIPLTKIEKEKTLLEWDKDAYREINKLLFDFQNELFEITCTQNYRIRNVTSTNEDLVTATVANGAGTGTYTISEDYTISKGCDNEKCRRNISR